MKALDDEFVDDLHELRELVRRSPDAARLRPIGLHEIVRGRGAVHSLSRVLERNGIRRHQVGPTRHGSTSILKMGDQIWSLAGNDLTVII